MPRPVNIHLFSNCDPASKFTWSSIYFHGNAEALVSKLVEAGKWECAPDIIGSDVDREEVFDGRHYVWLYDRRAYVFIWTSGYVSMNDGGKIVPWLLRHGLVVLEDDDKAYEYADKMYEERARSI